MWPARIAVQAWSASSERRVIISPCDWVIFLRLVCAPQMMLLQSTHYLALSFLTPFAAHGAPSIDLVLDWRELAGLTIDEHIHGGGEAYVGGKQINVKHLVQGAVALEERALASPLMLAACWLLASLVEWVPPSANVLLRVELTGIHLRCAVCGQSTCLFAVRVWC